MFTKGISNGPVWLNIVNKDPWGISSSRMQVKSEEYPKNWMICGFFNYWIMYISFRKAYSRKNMWNHFLYLDRRSEAFESKLSLRRGILYLEDIRIVALPQDLSEIHVEYGDELLHIENEWALGWWIHFFIFIFFLLKNIKIIIKKFKTFPLHN